MTTLFFKFFIYLLLNYNSTYYFDSNVFVIVHTLLVDKQQSTSDKKMFGN